MVLAYTKKGVYEGLKTDLETVLSHEEFVQAECIRSGEAKAGMTRFLMKRALRKEKNESQRILSLDQKQI